MSKTKWPDEIREEMIRKSEYYDNSQIYQYGYYDGFQKGVLVTQEELREALCSAYNKGYNQKCDDPDICIDNLINSLTKKK